MLRPYSAAMTLGMLLLLPLVAAGVGLGLGLGLFWTWSGSIDIEMRESMVSSLIIHLRCCLFFLLWPLEWNLDHQNIRI